MFHFGSITLWYVIFGTVLVAISASSVGTLTLLQRKPLAGDAIAHSLLPGLCIAFLIIGKKSLLSLLIGAFITGLLAFWAIDEITKRSKIKKDTAIALVLSLFFGVGLLLLTYIQHSGNEAQAGLTDFLFGNSASLQLYDIKIFSSLSIILLLVLVLFFRGFKIVIFDRDFAITIGYPVVWIEALLRILVVLSIVLGIQSVGLVLMTAMLIAPSMAALFWSNRLRFVLCISAFFASISAVGGTVLSYQITHLPTGPCIVLIMAAIAIFSFLFAPKKGVVAKAWLYYRYKQKVLHENLLKLFVTLGKIDSKTLQARSLDSLLAHSHLSSEEMVTLLEELSSKGFLTHEAETFWSLTEKGRKRGEEVQRLHLLWETYLIQHLNIASDHVHEDAESMEHLLTPQLRKELEKLVDY